MTIPAEQEETARFLTALSGRPPTETHISAVFIGSDTVWKLKKAVRMPFLDFTTMNAREHFLRRELQLNKPAAPGIYRDVVAIARHPDGSLGFGGDTPIDWLLRMAPVPNSDFLDVIASEGRLTPALLDALGDCVAAYHAGLNPLPNRDSAATLLRITEGNVRSALAAGLPAETVHLWHHQMTAAIEQRRQWLTDRSATGYVRRCHGDLHLGNLCLWNGQPVPFDALEFDEDLAIIDVGYDIAFLLMDLDHRVGRDAANRVFNRYVARGGDVMTRGLPVFLSQRAMIRAHVVKAMGQDAQAYLAAAITCLHPPLSLVVAIGGLQGTGKSTVARALAPALGAAPGAVIVRSDEIRKRLHGVEPAARLPRTAYTEAANIATNAAVIAQARTAAASGHAVIVDATFLDPAVRQDLAASIRQTGAPFVGIWLQAPLALLEQRVFGRKHDASDATVSVLRRSAQHDPGPGSWLPIDASDGNEAQEAIRRHIAIKAATRVTLTGRTKSRSGCRPDPGSTPT